MKKKKKKFTVRVLQGGEDGGQDSNVIVARLTGGIEYGRPLATGWSGTLGVNWQRARCVDERGKVLTQV
jgi:outer membrane protein insertion porin family